MYRGLNPRDVTLQRALGYMESLEGFYDRDKRMFRYAIMEALAEAFGEGTPDDDDVQTYRAP